jgi:hypothetical protein
MVGLSWSKWNQIKRELKEACEVVGWLRTGARIINEVVMVAIV